MNEPQEQSHNHKTISDEKFGSGMKALVKSLRMVFFVLTVLIIALFVWMFTFGGFFIVNPNETVIVFRFGKYFGTYTESWHWMFPYPVDKAIVLPTNTKKRITTNAFWSREGRDLTKAAPGSSGKTLNPGEDGYLLTSDANIMHTRWEMLYEITNPDQYYLNCMTPEDPRKPDEVFTDPEREISRGSRGPATTLKNILETCIIKVTAQHSVDEIYSSDRVGYNEKVQREVINAVQRLDIGVSVSTVMLLDIKPPAGTKAAFDDVINVQQESNLAKQKAAKFRIEELSRADSETSRLLSEARTYRKETISSIKSEVTYFNAILEKHIQSPKTTLITLYNQGIAEALEQARDKFIIRKNKAGTQQIRLKLNPEPRVKKRKKNQKD